MCIRDRFYDDRSKITYNFYKNDLTITGLNPGSSYIYRIRENNQYSLCLLYTSDAADDLLCVDLGGRRIIKKKNKKQTKNKTITTYEDKSL